MKQPGIQPLIIIGAGGLGREAAWLVEDINKASPQWDLIGFVDDGKHGATVEGYPIVGDVNSLFNMSPMPWVVVAIANTEIRKKIIADMQQQKVPLATLVHPSVMMSRFVNIAAGSIVCAGAVLTTNVALGLAAIINPNCFIGHDTVLQDFVSLMPGVHVAGEVAIEEGVFIGLGAGVINRKKVGKWSMIGAGATVVSDIPPYSLAVGVPARVLPK